jgi:hypothetical protein
MKQIRERINIIITFMIIFNYKTIQLFLHTIQNGLNLNCELSSKNTNNGNV